MIHPIPFRWMLCVLGLAAWLPQASLAADFIKMDDKQVRALGIETRALQSNQQAIARGFPAQVMIPNRQIRVVATPVAGMVETMALATHEPVKQGQLLARLQSTGLIEMQREYIHAASEAELARESLKRDEGLFREGIIAESRYLAIRTRHAQAMASLSERTRLLRLNGMTDGAINALRAGKGLSSTLEITAPISGVVLEQMTTVGSRLEAAAPVYKVAQLVPLWLEIQVPAATAAGIAPGAAVAVGAATGKVLTVGRQINPANQTVTVRAEISRGADALRPGQYVEARIQAAGVEAGSWVVPTASLLRHQGKTYLLVQASGGFRVVEVQLLGETADSATVKGAFNGSERIVVKGMASLKGVWTGVGGGE